MSEEDNKRNAKANENEVREGYIPFESVEEAWFWFITAQQARNDGARYVEGAGNIRRPCEPVDILKVLDSLYRKRRLFREHFLVLRHYGRRFMAPDPSRAKEQRAYYLWKEAIDRIEPVLERKGIIKLPHWTQQYGFAFEQEELEPA